MRSRLEEVAAERPLVVVFDDIQWGERDLSGSRRPHRRPRPAGRRSSCSASPDPTCSKKRTGWGGGKLNARAILLEPLTADECSALIDSHGGIEPDATRTRILAVADGNPLFVEEMVALARGGGDVGVPATVHALLARHGSISSGRTSGL